jgi:hypothetical protein
MNVCSKPLVVVSEDDHVGLGLHYTKHLCEVETEAGCTCRTRSGIQSTSDAQIDGMAGIVRDPTKPIGLRLALLREMSRRQLADETAWAWLLANESDENLSFVLAALAGYENKSLQEPLIAMLGHPSTGLAEGAARALRHPAYMGAETSLQPLLAGDNQRLNYAAAQGLMGINSPRARTILADAAARHHNDKVRRMISARLSLLG